MKKKLLLFAIGLVLLTQTKAQTSIYHTFPDSNAVWGLSSGCWDGNCGGWGYVKDYYTSDTVIGSFSYKIINEIQLTVTSGSCCGLPGGSGYGFLREDTAARKVYWRGWGMDSDSLLYDFTLHVGDTIKGFLNPTKNGIIVQSIDSVFVGATYRKRFNIDTIFGRKKSIIEGIGATTNLTDLFWNVWQFGTTLCCFSVNENVIYSDPDNSDSVPCGSLTVNANTFERKNIVGVFPNPTQDFITLEFQFEFLPVNVRIFTVQGDIILAKQVQSTEHEIDISNMPNGIYFLQARTDNFSQQ